MIYEYYAHHTLQEAIEQLKTIEGRDMTENINYLQRKEVEKELAETFKKIKVKNIEGIIIELSGILFFELTMETEDGKTYKMDLRSSQASCCGFREFDNELKKKE